MGVSGSGKTTVGKGLSHKLGMPFFDGDDFHPPGNIQKMESGNALTDDDRSLWLKRIHDFVGKQIQVKSMVFACSALKENYRKILSKGMEDSCIWIFLDGDVEIIQQRLALRQSHFMPASLLQSQFDTLEKPEYGIRVDIRRKPEEILSYIIDQINS